MKKIIISGAAFTLAAIASTGVAFAAAPTTTTVVTPSAMQGWSFIDDTNNGAPGSGSGALVYGPSIPPLGTGSAQLTATSSRDGQILQLPGYNGMKFSSLTALSYASFESAQNNSTAAGPSLQFNVSSDVTSSSTAYQGRIVYEPYSNNGGSVTLGTWNTWNALASNAVWWFSKPTAFGGMCPQSAPCTLATIEAAYPNVGVSNLYGAVLFKAGSNYTNFSSNVDDLTIGTATSTTTFDFEAAPPSGLSSTDKQMFIAELNALQAALQALETEITNLIAAINASGTGTGTGTGTTTNPGGGTGTTTPPTTTPVILGTINPTSTTVRAGTSVNFGGRDFGHEETVAITLAGSQVGSVHADGGGNFSTGSFGIPSTPGTYVYTFTGQTSNVVASSTVTVTQ